MTTESGTWTVLPNGYDRDRDLLRATLFFSPRLSTDGAAKSPLTDFGLLAQWPSVVSSLRFRLDFGPLGVVEAEPDPVALKPDQAVFDQVFDSRVFVVDHEFADHSEQVVHWFPANDLANDLLSTYAAVGAASPTALPPVTAGPLATFADDLGSIGNDPERLHKRLGALLDAEESSVVEGRRGRYVTRAAIAALGRPGQYALAQRFYDRYRDGTRLRTEAGHGVPALPPPELRPIDFHAYVGALGDYPNLMRLLGLAVDVVAKVPFDPGGPAQGRVHVEFDGAPDSWFDEPGNTPWTMWEYDQPRWIPLCERTRPAYSQGQLNFHAERFWVHQIDIDGSVLKALNAASSLLSQKATVTAVAEPSMTEDQGSLPALRGAGFTVVRSDRVVTTVAQFDHGLVNNGTVGGPTRAELYAEDLTRGYRLDVDKDGQGFRSLCQRVGAYAVTQADGSTVPVVVPDDEGYVKGGSVSSVPGDKDLYLHDALFSWSGWSMVAERPGRRLKPEDEVDTEDEPLETSSDVPLVTSFRPAPKSLTPLRYGSSYRLRARLVDLAGNSVDDKALTDDEPSDKRVFLRWEPVPAPVVLERRGFGEGESQLRMVVRSTLGLTPGAYVTLPRVTALTGHTGPDTAYLATDTRWVVPPRTSQQMAEYHGVFDAAFGSGASPADVAAQYAVGQRESGQLPEVGPQDGLVLPYLPDVSARVAAFAGLPGVASATFRQDWPTDDGGATPPWWDRQPFRVEVVEGPAAAPVVPVGSAAAPQWDPAARVLTVAVPQAEVVRVKVSSGLEPADLGIQGGWSLLKASASAATRNAALDGRVWMVTPGLTLTLVHAVEKPLEPPVVLVGQDGMERLSGEEFCVLRGAVGNHAKSTGRLDIDAEWHEQVDDLGRDLPEDGVDGRELRDGHSHVGDFELAATESPANVGRTTVRGNGLPTRHELRHQLGDTRHRLVSYRATATTRFREYFAPEVATTVGEDGVLLTQQVGDPVQRHVPSSRRPEPPEIAYVIPTYSWSETTTTLPLVGGPLGGLKGGPKGGVGGGLAGPLVGRPVRVTTRTRTGGLRVYLRRPWFSSGDGELLGVVLKQQPWLTWVLDEASGMRVSAAARAAADLVADRLLDRGVVRARAVKGAGPSERLARALGVTTGGAVDAAAAQTMRAGVVEALSSVDAELSTHFVPLQVPAPADLLTVWGADPAYQGAGPGGGPYIHQFGQRVHVDTDVVPVEEVLSRVTVVGHQPVFDPERGLWCADIALPSGAAYTPFVRLALCRYQEWSIPGHHMSKVVRAQMAQLPAPRTLEIRHLPTLSVSLSGPAGSRYRLDHPDDRRAQLRIERRRVDGTDLDWVQVGDAVGMSATVGPSGLGDVRWSGRIDRGQAPEGQELRLVVEEFESFPTDPDADDPLDSVWSTGGEFPTSMRERLVYVDQVPL